MTEQLSLNPVYLSARAAIIAPERAVPVTIYAIQHWLPRLGSERWALIMLLRGMCIDSPRRSDGTKQVVCSLQDLADALDIHKRTLLRWFKHEPIANTSPWRQLAPTDEKSKYLALFIPRLRYAYESRNGKGKRVGLVLEVLMEDPIIPEDEAKLKQQVEQLQLQQGQLQLDTYHLEENSSVTKPVSDSVTWQNVTSNNYVNGQNVTLHDPTENQNTISSPVKRQNVTSENSVNGQNVTSHPEPSNQSNSEQSQLKSQNVTSHSVKRQNVTLDDSVKRQNVTLDDSVKRQNVTSDNSVKGHFVTSHSVKRQNVTTESLVKGQNVTLDPRISDSVNVNMLTNLLLFLNNLKDLNVNALETHHLEPTIQITETLLDDTHSTGMLYKVLSKLYPTHLDLFAEAIQTTLLVAQEKSQANKGAIFVTTLRKLADTAQVDLGFKSTSPDPPSVLPSPAEPTQMPMILNASTTQSTEALLWEKTKQILHQQLASTTYQAVIEGTQLMGQADGTYLIGVHSQMAYTWLQNRLTEMVQRALSTVIGIPVCVKFKLMTEID